MLSYALIGLLQEGHREDGHMIDLLRGIRYMQTFKKEPISAPKTKRKMYKTI